MLSLDLENKLINHCGYGCNASWYYLTQSFLPNDQQEATLSGYYELNKNGERIAPCISIVYDGTDEDFLKKYKECLNNWTEQESINFHKQKYNIDTEKAEELAREASEYIYKEKFLT